jgi:hypothetical protein
LISSDFAVESVDHFQITQSSRNGTSWIDPNELDFLHFEVHCAREEIPLDLSVDAIGRVTEARSVTICVCDPAIGNRNAILTKQCPTFEITFDRPLLPFAFQREIPRWDAAAIVTVKRKLHSLSSLPKLPLSSHFTELKPEETCALNIDSQSQRVRATVAAAVEFRGAEIAASIPPQQIEALHAEIFK